MVISKKQIVSDLFAKWAFLVVDQGYQFEIFYYKNYLESGELLDSDKTTMQVWPSWAYKYAKIAVSIDLIEKASRLEWVVIHELVHILMGDCDYETNDMYERACSELASAILKASVHFA